MESIELRSQLLTEAKRFRKRKRDYLLRLIFSGRDVPPLIATLRFTSKQSVWDLRIMRFRVCERERGWNRDIIREYVGLPNWPCYIHPTRV